MLAAAFTSIALLPGLLTGTVDTVKTQTPLPVLLPSNFYSDFDPLYPYGGGTKKSYDIGVAAAPDCGGANACFAASFSGEKGGSPYGRGKVTLAKGRHGRYQPLGCGASCSPPSISWKERGVTYTIQAKVVGKQTDRALLVKMANEAITQGPR
ncbi:MAG TPA: hypothetical protein VI300_09630 [Solirubrobacter sp.]